jgi:hypothetical protein
MFLAVAVLVASAAPSAAETVDQILARALAGRGGEAKVRGVSSVRLTGKVRFGGGDFQLEASFATLQKRGGKLRQEFSLQGLTQVSAYDGTDAWQVSPFGGRKEAEKSSADEAKSLAQQADWDGPLVDWRAKGHKIEDLGTEDVDGTPAIKLRVTLKDGDIEYFFLDPDSALPIRTQTIHKVRGSEEVSETDYGNYQQVGGLWVPFALESGSRGGGAKNFKITVERIEFNVTAEDAWFKFPGAGQTATAVIVPGPPDKTPPSTVPPPKVGSAVVDAGTISGLNARNIGSATMSGRIAAVAATLEGGKTILYIGAASGGVWKSIDGGTTFKPVFDKQPVQSIGAITIDPTNPKTVWVGTGESWTRNSVSIGDGIYKSTDEGETWTHMGLPSSERIARILVHPKNGNIVWACVPGKLWSDSTERGLYKTVDGGKTWTHVLRGANASTGCSSVTLDPKNPDVMLAGTWDFRRKGWTFRSGGEGPTATSASGMHRSTDGGKTWTQLSPATNKGLPKGPWGRVEVVYAPSNNKIVYAFIESTASAR